MKDNKLIFCNELVIEKFSVIEDTLKKSQRIVVVDCLV